MSLFRDQGHVYLIFFPDLVPPPLPRQRGRTPNIMVESGAQGVENYAAAYGIGAWKFERYYKKNMQD